jgi:DNA ligase-1
MRRFAELYQALDASTATGDKLAALRAYYGAAPPADAAWATYFLAGGKPRRVLPTALLRAAACRAAGIEDWLFEACYQAAGDLAETIALVLPAGRPGLSPLPEASLAEWVERRLLPLRGLPAAEQITRIEQAWAGLDAATRFVLIKLIGGGFRVGVSRLLVQRALAEQFGLDPRLLAQRMVGWTDASARPDAAAFAALTGEPGGTASNPGLPYPFFLAHPLQAAPETLGPAQDWMAEWKYDGIRAQVVRRAGQTWIWSRGEELITDRFPEVVARAASWPEGTVVDGELLVWPAGAATPAPFQQLQQRINRKTLSRKLLADAPVRLLAYDLLEQDGTDLRQAPQWQRRARLLALAADPQLAAKDAAGLARLEISPQVASADWAALAAQRLQSRERGVEGLMLKHREARYGIGRTKADGVWWKWKVDPLAVDAVLVYAQAGHGRRAGVYTDYTFAVWSRPPRDAAEALAVVEAIARREPAPAMGSDTLQLLPFAKAYSGLSDAEFAQVDRVIRASTLQKFGPVRSVRPSQVFEIGFEGINASPRHKSGVAVRFPRMLRIRSDKPLHEADSLQTLRALMGPA